MNRRQFICTATGAATLVRIPDALAEMLVLRAAIRPGVIATSRIAFTLREGSMTRPPLTNRVVFLRFGGGAGHFLPREKLAAVSSAMLELLAANKD